MDTVTLAALLAALPAAGFVAGFAAAALRRRRRRDAAFREEPESEHLHDRIWRIAESEERYRSLVAATMDVIVQRDALGRITFANEGFARLIGRAPLALIGASVDLAVLEQGAVSVGPDGVRRAERRIRGADGTARWYAFVEMPVGRPDEPLQWLCAGCDITGRVEAVRSLDDALAKAEAANVAKSRFLATVSHEFRTPLNGILGMTDLVLATGLDAEQRTYVEAVRTSGKALLGLIDGILDFSRIEAGRIDLAAEPFDPAAIAEGVVELLAPRAQDKGIEIALDVAGDLPRRLIGDADRVRQILLNLAGNAVKFTGSGGVGVALSQVPEGLCLSVSDTGPGIPEERLPILFEEFEQGDGSASRRHEGTGLGLAITRRLAIRMGGRVEADSQPGHGSTFRAILPLPPAAEAAQDPAPMLHGQRVLIVADSPFQAPYLAQALARAGAPAVIVGDLTAGLDALAGARFDALIADRTLGDAAVRRLADEARLCGVASRVILLSPFDRREFGAPAAAGFCSYLIKPVRARSLIERLLVPAAPRDAAPAPALPAPPRPAARRRVLLAEDNPINALLATRALERLGAEVVHAADGLEALARHAEGGPFDLALIDVRMPNLDGHETARRIRAAEAGGPARLHLVALTANAGREDERAAREAGFDGFLAKPLDLKALPGLLERDAAAA
ncbi:ATP-binding protein [Methylobacterium symbioticum]|uniref:Sensory/regulatory protein RpfC n=1 Tax=Methylobacterium symbioticum TaxID=2584084 RepID=A0A509EKG3_9HYPH|nr:ATP-binding protein [Methylobacterium symbioticum]VUD73969.1 Signal transduction histidine-protein kinase BarA [Methylobacterium symbioticum]